MVWLLAASPPRSQERSSSASPFLGFSFFFYFFFPESKQVSVPASAGDQMEKIREAGGVDGARLLRSHLPPALQR